MGKFFKVAEALPPENKKLFIMRGIPGAGKSTLAKKIQKVHPGAIIAANDDYFYDKDGKYNWSPERAKEATRFTKRRVQHGLKEGKTVIADSLSINHKGYDKLLQAARKYKAVPHEVPVYFDKTNPKLYAKRNVHNVPEVAIKSMMNWYQEGSHPFLKSEKFTKYIKLLARK